MERLLVLKTKSAADLQTSRGKKVNLLPSDRRRENESDGGVGATAIPPMLLYRRRWSTV